MPRAHPMNPVRVLRGLRARPRLLGCAAVGTLAYFAARALLPMSGAGLALIAWNTGALLYLATVWELMARTGVQGIRDKALSQDEGRIAILVFVILATLAVLLAVGTQLAQVKDLHGRMRAIHVVLAALTVLTSWLFTQVLFALHYAHDFYAARIRAAPDPRLFL